jgi:glycosyltransferase involved in cell wall biosynthesis
VRILVCPADRGGCGHYRMIWPAQACAAEGLDVHVLAEDEVLTRGYYDNDDQLVGIAPVDADVVVLQRCLDRRIVEMIPHLQAQGIAVVVEIDDDFTCIDPDNVAHKAADPAEHPDRNYYHLVHASSIADLVTVSTGALARRFGGQGRVAVLPNCIPASYLNEPGRRTLAGKAWTRGHKVRVGWSGSVDTHPGDLNVTGGAVGLILHEQRGTAHFSVVGTGKGVREALFLHDEPTKTGWVTLTDYPKAVAQLDLGIVPLKASAFNRAKSWLKGLEMAACGVPFVASTTPEYERLAKHGAGRLAARPRDWGRELSRMIRDHAWRAEVAERGKDTAARWTIEEHAPAWYAAWCEAATIRRAA